MNMSANYVTIVTIFAFLCENNLAANLQNSSDLRLEFVQVIFPHGDRTPERPFGNDPNINGTFNPYSWCSLDKAGRQSSYNLGLYGYEAFEPETNSVKMFPQDSYGMIIPDWAKPFYPDRFKAFSEKAFYLAVRTDKLVRLREGAFLGHLIKQLGLKARGSKMKFWLYSGNDLKIINLGKALRIWKGVRVDFSSALIMELHTNSLGQHFVSRWPTFLQAPSLGV